jgi:phage baseplate assembly protein W
MSQAKTDLWGQDIALDASGAARVAANGELILTDGVETGVQDIRLRLFTRLGSLFYDSDFGSLVHDWILEESTRETRSALCAEVLMRVEADPRVEPYSVSARILAWDEISITVEARWRFIGEDQPQNLVMQLNKATRELIVEDANPAPHTLQESI